MDADRLASFFGPPRGCAQCFAAELADRGIAINRSLPDGYVGSNRHLKERIIASLRADEGLAHVIPVACTDEEGDGIIWNQYFFDNVLLGPIPEEGVADPITKQASAAGDTLRYGRAMHLPFGFDQATFDAELARVTAACAAAIAEDAPRDDGPRRTLIGHADMQLMQNAAANYIIIGSFSIYYKTV